MLPSMEITGENWDFVLTLVELLYGDFGSLVKFMASRFNGRSPSGMVLVTNQPADFPENRSDLSSIACDRKTKIAVSKRHQLALTGRHLKKSHPPADAGQSVDYQRRLSLPSVEQNPSIGPLSDPIVSP